ncbi:hypothetical protein H0H92_015485, partial [Tricholoma furcatifolium]
MPQTAKRVRHTLPASDEEQENPEYVDESRKRGRISKPSAKVAITDKENLQKAHEELAALKKKMAKLKAKKASTADERESDDEQNSLIESEDEDEVGFSSS